MPFTRLVHVGICTVCVTEADDCLTVGVLFTRLVHVGICTVCVTEADDCLTVGAAMSGQTFVSNQTRWKQCREPFCEKRRGVGQGGWGGVGGGGDLTRILRIYGLTR